MLYGLFQPLVLGGFPADAPVGGIATDGRFGNDMLGPNNQAVALVLPLVIALSRIGIAPREAQSADLRCGRGADVGRHPDDRVARRHARHRRRDARPDHGERRRTGQAAEPHPCGCPAGAPGLRVQAAGDHRARGRDHLVIRTNRYLAGGLGGVPQYRPVGAGWGTFPDVYAATQSSVPDAAVLVGKGSYESHTTCGSSRPSSSACRDSCFWRWSSCSRSSMRCGCPRRFVDRL